MTVVKDVMFYDGDKYQGSEVTLKLVDGRKWEVIPQGSDWGAGITTIIDSCGLIAIPAGIDPHVHFRTPGAEHKENWKSGAMSGIAGGYTTVLDMPNTNPPCTSEEAFLAKDALVRKQLEEVGLPKFRYALYLGGDRAKFAEIERVKDRIIAIKVYMGSSTGDLLMDDEPSLRKLFEIAKKFNLLVAVHAEDEHMIQENLAKFTEKKFTDHSEIRNPQVAAKATQLAINLTREIGNSLYIVHVSTKEEIDLIRAAKKEGLPVYAEATPHHLFLNTSHYHMHGYAQMNPPLRPMEHNQALLDAINEGVIDTIGSDHAPHTIAEKEQCYGKCPSGVPGIETTLPLLFNAYNKQQITIQKIVELTSINPRKIFKLPETSDMFLVDLDWSRMVERERLYTKCKWSPFEGIPLKCIPMFTILAGEAIGLSGNFMNLRETIEVEGPVRELQDIARIARYKD